jgi:DNA-3-methyladenine glycosylase II
VNTFTLPAKGPFSLASSIAFLKGFAPASYDAAPGEALELAFPVERSWQTAAVRVTAYPRGVHGEIVRPRPAAGELTEAVRTQTARILSLDVDGSGFPAVGARDKVIARLQDRYPGLRPVCFYSPYEAAAWTIIGHRLRIRQAAAIKARMAEQFGRPVAFGDRTVHAFPPPQRLAELQEFPGLTGRKPEWLRALAAAALKGRLDAATLRALPPEQAIAQLKELPGIGDFSAELVLLRGAGDPDRAPHHEPRLDRAVALAYDLPEAPTGTELDRISDNWKPYRTWVCLLLRTQLEDEASGTSANPARPRL